MSELHSSELQQFRDMVKRFLDKEIKPFYNQWEKDGIIPRDVWHTMGANGLLAVDLPEEYGGSGVSYLYSMVVLEEAAYANYGSLATGLSVHSDIAAPYVLHIGNEAQRQQWLPKMASGEVIGAIGMTEPGAGSDLQAIRTTAILHGDHYLLNGSKTFITNGQHADLVILAAKTDPNAGAKGVSLFLVDMNLAGCARGRNLEKMGLHAQDTSELFFDNVKLPLDSILGEAGKGFSYLMNELPRERLNLSVCAVAASEGLLADTVAYTQERIAFGKPISQLQNTRFTLATCHTDIAINRAFVDSCVNLYMEGKLDATKAAVAKLSSTDMQGRVADACLQMFGGYGYMLEYPAARAYVDARIQRIYGGTNEIMKEVIARSLVGR